MTYEESDEALDNMTAHERETVLSRWALEDAPDPGNVLYFVAAQLAVMFGYVGILTGIAVIVWFAPLLLPVGFAAFLYATWKLSPRWLDGMFVMLYLYKKRKAHRGEK